MARKHKPAGKAVQHLFKGFTWVPVRARLAIVAVLLIGVAAFHIVNSRQPPPGANLPPGANTVVLCHWNMENLFDDKDDKRNTTDEPYDNWFANDPATRKMKYQHITDTLLKLNGGNGPDIIVGNEIESYRAAELLKDSLNANLPASAAKYEYVEMKELPANAGRYIAPCVISRYPLSEAKLLRSRIGFSKFTSRSTITRCIWSRRTGPRKFRTGATRRTAGLVRIRSTTPTRRSHANPKVDFLVCGDFNDSPTRIPSSITST